MREEDKPCSLGFSVQAVLLDLRSTHLARDNAGMSVETMTHEIYSKGQFCSRCEGIGFHLIEITYYYYYYQYRGFLRRIRWTMNILVCALRTRASATSAPPRHPRLRHLRHLRAVALHLNSARCHLRWFQWWRRFDRPHLQADGWGFHHRCQERRVLLYRRWWVPPQLLVDAKQDGATRAAPAPDLESLHRRHDVSSKTKGPTDALRLDNKWLQNIL